LFPRFLTFFFFFFFLFALSWIYDTGLQRCRKSCRLRWINYLRPGLKRGSFSPQEAALIIELHRSLGNRWSQIAKHLPGRTDNEVKNFWHTSLKKKLKSSNALNLPGTLATCPDIGHPISSGDANPNLIINSQQDQQHHIPTPITMLQVDLELQHNNCCPTMVNFPPLIPAVPSDSSSYVTWSPLVGYDHQLGPNQHDIGHPISSEDANPNLIINSQQDQQHHIPTPITMLQVDLELQHNFCCPTMVNFPPLIPAVPSDSSSYVTWSPLVGYDHQLGPNQHDIGRPISSEDANPNLIINSQQDQQHHIPTPITMLQVDLELQHNICCPTMVNFPPLIPAVPSDSSSYVTWSPLVGYDHQLGPNQHDTSCPIIINPSIKESPYDKPEFAFEMPELSEIILRGNVSGMLPYAPPSPELLYTPARLSSCSPIFGSSNPYHSQLPSIQMEYTDAIISSSSSSSSLWPPLQSSQFLSTLNLSSI
jgi:hypothetical protein